MEATEEFDFYTQRIDAAGYEHLLIQLNRTYYIQIQSQGNRAASVDADGVASFDWPVLKTMADSDSKDTAHVIARLLIAAREEGRKETP